MEMIREERKEKKKIERTKEKEEKKRKKMNEFVGNTLPTNTPFGQSIT